MGVRVCLTGGIACGKSQVARFLNALGVETLDADDIVHELVPDEERRRLAKVVFDDPVARHALEARLHPLVRARIDAWLAEKTEKLRIAVIPLLFETHWDAEYDIICTVVSTRESQIERMMTTRGYTLAESESRLAAQIPVAEKAAKSQYVIKNDGSVEELKQEAEKFVIWLKNSMCSRMR